MKAKTESEEFNLIQIIDQFSTDEKAREKLESIRWKDGIVCPHCKCSDQSKFSSINSNPEKKIRAGLRWCSNCRKQFTVTVGTIFEDSHIPLRKWLIAWYLLCSSKKGISSLQIQRVLGLGSYRTALFMMHRIRHALKDPSFNEKLSGTVEADETYVGGKTKGLGGGYKGNKTPVVSLVERKGRVKSKVIERVTGKNIRAFLTENVELSANLMTDEHRSYRAPGHKFKSHQVVKHGMGEYVRGDVYTNTVEGFFSLLKRGIVGTFHHVSKRHLPLYLAEFDHRYNTRHTNDGERTFIGLKQVEGKRLLYS